MPIIIHNYTWSGERLVQIESQPSHIDGVLDCVQDVRRNSIAFFIEMRYKRNEINN